MESKKINKDTIEIDSKKYEVNLLNEEKVEIAPLKPGEKPAYIKEAIIIVVFLFGLMGLVEFLYKLKVETLIGVQNLLLVICLVMLGLYCYHLYEKLKEKTQIYKNEYEYNDISLKDFLEIKSDGSIDRRGLKIISYLVFKNFKIKLANYETFSNDTFENKEKELKRIIDEIDSKKVDKIDFVSFKKDSVNQVAGIVLNGEAFYPMNINYRDFMPDLVFILSFVVALFLHCKVTDFVNNHGMATFVIWVAFLSAIFLTMISAFRVPNLKLAKRVMEDKRLVMSSENKQLLEELKNWKFYTKVMVVALIAIMIVIYMVFIAGGVVPPFLNNVIIPSSLR